MVQKKCDSFRFTRGGLETDYGTVVCRQSSSRSGLSSGMWTIQSWTSDFAILCTANGILRDLSIDNSSSLN